MHVYIILLYWLVEHWVGYWLEASNIGCCVDAADSLFAPLADTWLAVVLPCSCTPHWLLLVVVWLLRSKVWAKVLERRVTLLLVNGKPFIFVTLFFDSSTLYFIFLLYNCVLTVERYVLSYFVCGFISVLNHVHFLLVRLYDLFSCTWWKFDNYFSWTLPLCSYISYHLCAQFYWYCIRMISDRNGRLSLNWWFYLLFVRMIWLVSWHLVWLAAFTLVGGDVQLQTRTCVK